MASLAGNPKKMKYRMLGTTGLQVSVLSFGFWATFGSKDSLQDDNGVDMAKKILTVCRKHGVNLFDNAETYGTPRGAAETCMGKAIRQLSKEDPELWRRSDILITTKIFWGGDGVNEMGLSRKHIKEGLTSSLKRLQMDYVDLVFCHRPDPCTPTTTVVQAMSEVVRSGLAHAWGTSEWSSQQITEAYWIAKTEGGIPPQMEQPQYNMFTRQRFESEYAPLFKAPYNLGTTIWSPLKGGFLTGKYNEEIPEGSRLKQKGYEFLLKRYESWKDEGGVEKARALAALGDERFTCSLTQLAIAWCLKNEQVSTVLLGATTVEQIEENLASLDVALRMTQNDLEAIESILGNKPILHSARSIDTL